MLEDDPPDDEDEPVDEPPDEDPPDPPPDGRDTAVPLGLPLDGRDSGRSFAWPANAGPTLSENVAAAAHKVTARRVMMMLLKFMWGSAPHPGSVACGDPYAPRRSLAGAPRALVSLHGEPKPAIPQNQKAMHLPAVELSKAPQNHQLRRRSVLTGGHRRHATRTSRL